MAINLETQYPGKVAPSTPDYPFGAARNITVPGDGTGTPWEATIVNDLVGMQQALLTASEIVPSGTPDKVGASQYLETIKSNGLTLTKLVSSNLFNTVPAGSIVVLAGYNSAGDGGLWPWKKTSTVSTVSQTPAQRGAAEFTDSVGVVWEIVPILGAISAQALGVTADGTDHTSSMNAAGASGYVVDISGLSGIYVTDKVTVDHIKGNSVTDSYLTVDAGFNMAATSILRINGTDKSVIHGGVGVVCQQPNVSERSLLNHYPWALDFEGVTRVTIEKFRCSGAWNGVNALGNTGGVSIEIMEIGAFNEGLNTAGAQDFFHANTLHFWPFGIVSLTNAVNIYYDGSTIGARFGTTDGLDIKTLSSFRARVITQTDSFGDGPFGCIGALQLDGSDAWINFSAGHVTVANFYSTSDKDGDRAIAVSGGELIIASHDITPFINSTIYQPHVVCSGGTLLLSGGVSRTTMSSAPNYKCTGGFMTMGPVEFLTGSNVNRTAGFIEQSGGRMTCIKPRFKDKGSATIGKAIIVTGGSWSTFDAAMLVGWGYQIPDRLLTNTYNFSEIITTIPEIKIEPLGDFSPSYTLQDCKYTLKDNYIDFSLQVTFNTNAYTSGTSVLSIVTNIPHVAGVMECGADIRSMSKVGFASNSFIAGEMIIGTSDIIVRNSLSGVEASSLSNTAIPPSVVGFKFVISGRYKAA